MCYVYFGATHQFVYLYPNKNCTFLFRHEMVDCKVVKYCTCYYIHVQHVKVMTSKRLIYFYLKMAVSLGSDLKTMEAFLQSLELESLATVFKDNNIDLNLLMGLSDDKLEAKLMKMNLLFGIRSRSKIMDKIKKMKADGKLS